MRAGAGPTLQTLQGHQPALGPSPEGSVVVRAVSTETSKSVNSLTLKNI